MDVTPINSDNKDEEKQDESEEESDEDVFDKPDKEELDRLREDLQKNDENLPYNVKELA
jgi:hypothetical protein